MQVNSSKKILLKFFILEIYIIRCLAPFTNSQAINVTFYSRVFFPRYHLHMLLAFNKYLTIKGRF